MSRFLHWLGFHRWQKADNFFIGYPYYQCSCGAERSARLIGL